jgi:RimJ/RimL family protein N-acetyltransferase
VTTVPRLETERLVLSAHEVSDFDALAAMWADPAVVRHVGGKAASRQEAWARLLRYRGLWPLLGYGYWAVREKGSGRFVGDVGFADFHRDMTPLIEGLPEMGWVLAPWAHGRGYASEAVRAALAWLDDATPHRVSVCIIVPDNTASLRVAAKTGFVHWQAATMNDHATMLLRREIAS